MTARIPVYPWWRHPLHYMRKQINAERRALYEGGVGMLRLAEEIEGFHASGPDPFWDHLHNSGVEKDYSPVRFVDQPPDGTPGLFYQSEHTFEALHRFDDLALHTRTEDQSEVSTRQIHAGAEYIDAFEVLLNQEESAEEDYLWLGNAATPPFFLNNEDPFAYIWRKPQSSKSTFSILALRKNGSLELIGSPLVKIETEGHIFRHVSYETSGFTWYDPATDGDYIVWQHGSQMPGTYAISELRDSGLGADIGAGWGDVLVSPEAYAPLGIAVKEGSYRLFGHFVLNFTAETNLSGIPFCNLRGDVLTSNQQSLQDRVPDPTTFPDSAWILTNDHSADNPVTEEEGAPWFRTALQTIQVDPDTELTGRPFYWYSESHDDPLQLWGGSGGPHPAVTGGVEWTRLTSNPTMEVNIVDYTATEVSVDASLIDWRIGLYDHDTLFQDVPQSSGYVRRPIVAACAVVLTGEGDLYLHRHDGRHLVDTNVFYLIGSDAFGDHEQHDIMDYRKTDGTTRRLTFATLGISAIPV